MSDRRGGMPGGIDQTSFQLGFEYGLSDRLTLSLNLPWVSSERDFAAQFGFETNDGGGLRVRGAGRGGRASHRGVRD